MDLTTCYCRNRYCVRYGLTGPQLASFEPAGIVGHLSWNVWTVGIGFRRVQERPMPAFDRRI